MDKRVLIVDGAAVTRLMIRRMLSAHGFAVVGEAESGVEAVEKYRSLAPDFVTMGVVMPGMDGMSAVREIIAGDADAKIILCTSIDEHQLIVEAAEAGVKSFISKPFAPPEMLATIAKVLK